MTEEQKNIYNESRRKYRQEHLEEILEKEKKYREEHKEETAARKKRYRDKHGDRIKKYTNSKENVERMKLYRIEHRDEIREQIKAKRKNKIEFRLAGNLRTRLTQAVKHKYKNTMDLVGCSIEELVKHLENQFQEGMSWENYGLKGWHVDHIRPCASFNLLNEEEQKACFHYTNLQPLWAIDNIRKHAKWEKEIP